MSTRNRYTQGHEIDALVDLGQTQLPVEVKSGETVVGDSFGGLRFFGASSRGTH